MVCKDVFFLLDQISNEKFYIKLSQFDKRFDQYIPSFRSVLSTLLLFKLSFGRHLTSSKNGLLF